VPTQIIDTPVVPDVLAEFRQQAKDEIAEKSERSKMSDAAVAKLRAMNEQTKAQEILDERFASALRLIVPTPENLLTLLDRCNHSMRPTQIERRAEKLAWWVTAGYRLGYEIDSVTMLNFFSTLVDDEVRMPASKFSSLWNLAAAAKLKESRINRGLIDSGIPEIRDLFRQRSEELPVFFIHEVLALSATAGEQSLPAPTILVRVLRAGPDVRQQAPIFLISEIVGRVSSRITLAGYRSNSRISLHYCAH
jgi:hypothetical protein